RTAEGPHVGAAPAARQDVDGDQGVALTTSTGMDAPRQRTFLPHALALLYGFAIVYASLQPFAPWIPPAPGTPFWPFAPWPLKWTRFDFTANVLAYIPICLFVALIPHRAAPPLRMSVALAAGVVLSFGMETLQMFLPSRDA